MSLVILLLDAVFVAVNYYYARRTLIEDITAETAALHSAFRTALKNAQSNLLLIASIFANEEPVQQLFLEAKNAVEAEGGGARGEGRGASVRQPFAPSSRIWSGRAGGMRCATWARVSCIFILGRAR